MYAVDIAHALYKRGDEPSPSGQTLPAWLWGIAFLDFIVFFPAFLLVGYSFQRLFPTLAIVEDPSPPAYEPLSLNDDGASIPGDDVGGRGRAAYADEAAAAAGRETRAVSSSFRGLYRAVTAVGGWRSLFRGLGCYAALSAATAALVGVLTAAYVPALLAAPLAALALTQLYTAWTHVAISAPPSPGSGRGRFWWRRLPPFGRSFRAAAPPMVVYLFAVELASLVPRLLLRGLGMNAWDPQQPGRLPVALERGDVWKAAVTLLVALVLHVGLVIPAQVVLVRVQASLLPEEDDTIVPFDRSFQGKVEPAIVGGRGYVTMMDAWRSFSRASWIRLVKLYVKIFLAGLAVSFAFAAVLIPEIFLVIASAKQDK
ncbi:putative ubiquitin conjugating enzyme [Xylariaceae sp. FL0804]|nr:putative ubiquitin conjugating enzyme [Xylariaceae sp. FL0804]